MEPSGEVAGGAVLIVAPLGKDAPLAAQVLQGVGIRAEVLPSLTEVAEELSDTTDALLISKQALLASEVPLLLDALNQQPAWSDVPVIVLTDTGFNEDVSLQMLELFGPRANITLLERPLRSVTLISTLQVAIRSRRRQREVRDLLEQRETALTSISDAFAALDRDFRYIYVNEKAAEYAGCSREEMIGRSVWEIYPEAKTEGAFREAAERAFETRNPQHFEEYYERWGCWLETRIYPGTDGIVVLRADITSRKQQETVVAESEQRLQEKETLLRLAIEAADLGTFEVVTSTHELRYSERLNEIFGLPKGTSASFEEVLELIHPEDREGVLSRLAAAQDPATDGRYEMEHRIVSSDGVVRWVGAKGRVVFNADQSAGRIIGTVLDITERKNAEIVLRAAKESAEKANRAKDRFLAMLSHELRTPLTPVLMTVASMQGDKTLGETARADLEVIRRNIELEALLIDDLLDLTRIQHGKLELHNDATDIHALLGHALAICGSDLEQKKLHVTSILEAKEHHCWADAARLQQVIWNLVKNAVKFTPGGGLVTVRTRNDDAHRIIIEVSDTGVGIEAALLPRIFDAFEQGGRAVTSQYGGLGLGLAISKSVVDLHHGTLTAHSAGSGQGATFTVTLQAIETSLLNGRVFRPEPHLPRGSARRLLLVEDHEDTARVLRRMLVNAGYEVAGAGSVAEARKLCAEADFDLLISDVGLPDGSGHDLVREVRAAKGLTGIALSGFGTEDDIAASLEAGFSEHLTKPVDWERLCSAIERLAAPAGVSVKLPAPTPASF